MRISRRDKGQVTIFSFEDEEQIQEPDLMQAEFNKLAKDNRVNVIYDFGNIHYISSSILGFLITSFRELESKGGSLKLLNVQPSVSSVLEITRLNRILEMFNDEETALKSF
jgi:anti-sigma B factor antagonist